MRSEGDGFSDRPRGEKLEAEEWGFPRRDHHGLAVAAAMTARGAGVAGWLLFGVALAAFATTYVAATATVAQVVGERRRVVGVSSALLTAGYVTRMIANSTDDRLWLRWTTPFGWLDQTHPYGANRWAVLTVPVVVSVVLIAVAVDLSPAHPWPRSGPSSLGAGPVALPPPRLRSG